MLLILSSHETVHVKYNLDENIIGDISSISKVIRILRQYKMQTMIKFHITVLIIVSAHLRWLHSQPIMLSFETGHLTSFDCC